MAGLKLSKYKRVEQWCVFARQWWLFDAQWQDPFDSAQRVARYLRGGHKPIFDTEQDLGDHVVVINARQIAMPDDEWRWRMYYHHSRYVRGKTWAPAWQLHQQDPTLVFYKAIFRALNDYRDPKMYQTAWFRAHRIARLHMYPDEDVPHHIMANVTDQIRQLRPVPKKVTQFSEEEMDKFPKIVDYPDEYAVK